MIARTSCPITGEPAEVIFSRPYSLPALAGFVARTPFGEKLVDKPYEIRSCPSSGLVFQTWVLEDSELADLYSSPTDGDYFRAQIANCKLHWFAHLTEEILVMRQVIETRLPVVLDFGCNWGKWASMALAHGCEVYAVEVDRAAAQFCATRGIRMISREQLPEMRFDFINVDQVMEHVSEPLAIARELARCLKPGAIMKWSTPDQPRLPQLLRASQANGTNAVLAARTIDPLAPLGHVNLFSNHSLSVLGSRVGLRVVRPPFWKWLGAGQLWNIPRQFNHNLFTPWKRWRMKNSYVWLQKPNPPSIGSPTGRQL